MRNSYNVYSNETGNLITSGTFAQIAMEYSLEVERVKWHYYQKLFIRDSFIVKDGIDRDTFFDERYLYNNFIRVG